MSRIKFPEVIKGNTTFQVSKAAYLTMGRSNKPMDSKSISEKSFTIVDDVYNKIKLTIKVTFVIIPI